MKRLARENRILIGGIAFAISFSALADSQTTPLGPRIKTDPEVFDFGCVPQGATVAHTFWLKNLGTETARIQKLVPNCGCTQVPPTDSTIAVGDSVPVEILFGTRNMSWKVEKFIRIVSNAKGRVPALTIRGFVLQKDSSSGVLEASPEILSIVPGESGKVSIRNLTGVPLVLRVVDEPPNHIRLDRKEIALGPGESEEITVSVTAGVGQQEYTKSVTIEADDPARTRVTIPLRGILTSAE